MNRPGLLAIDLRHDTSPQPKHERLKHHLSKQIALGRLRVGEALPSENIMVEQLGVARSTIRQAMKSLEEDGIIRRVQGKGTFVEADARRKLKRGQDIFALVVPMTHGGFFPSLLHGFEAAAGEIHHQMLVCNNDDNVDRQASIVLQLLDKEIGGMAIMPATQPSTPAYQIRQLQARGIPVVFCHRRVEGIAAPLLATPYVGVGRLAGKTLVELGHRRIAFLVTFRSHVSMAYEEGLQEALLDGGGVSAESVFVAQSIHFREADVWAALQALFARPEPPTAIFASFDSLAEMIYLLLPRLGLRVPEDVSLLGFGGAWREGAMEQRLTSVVLDEIAAGRQAVSFLHEMRTGQRPIDDTTEVVLNLAISKGATLAAPARTVG